MIFCVDDDNAIRDIEVYTLNSTGFEARGFEDGQSLLKALEEELPRLIILDIMMPGEDGISVLKKIRSDERTKSVPVIMATAKGMEYDRITGLDTGADDYIVKPFGVMEMVSRVKAVLRRCEKPDDRKTLSAAGITMYTEERKVTCDGEDVKLTYKEYELLHLFLSNRSIVFTRDQILTKVWGIDYFGETRTVDMHIKTLRQKLGKYGSLIKTVINVGYRLEE